MDILRKVEELEKKSTTQRALLGGKNLVEALGHAEAYDQEASNTGRELVFKKPEEMTITELELFHSCGCPIARKCVCIIYTEGEDSMTKSYFAIQSL